jgi:hypothetical protein
LGCFSIAIERERAMTAPLNKDDSPATPRLEQRYSHFMHEKRVSIMDSGY